MAVSLAKISTDTDCGHVAISNGFATGCAITTDGRRICYACADAEQRANVTDPATTRFVAYVSSDGRSITTWSGGELARVVGTRLTKFACQSGRLPFDAITPDGRRWYGRGEPGMYVTLRTFKRV